MRPARRTGHRHTASHRDHVTQTPVLRHCTTHDEFDACVRLQQATWGESYRDSVPASLLKVSQRVGGIVAGAFDAEDALIGFAWGLTGPDGHGRLLHWSHMLAVRADWRDRGVGRALKHFQRAALRGTGVETIAWTFDPLVARNAHLNLNRLGARIAEYVPDMYAETGSGLHAFGTDRMVATWPVETSGPGPDGAGAGTIPSHVAAAAPIVSGTPAQRDGAMPWPGDGGPVRIEVPADIETIARERLAEARAWRDCSRAAFLEAARRGYSVTGFARTEERCFYVLTAA